MLLGEGGIPKQATFEKLVEWLTPVGSSDPERSAVFLLTYRYFAHSRQLFQALQKRFESAQNHDQKTGMQIRARVCNVLKSWLSNHFGDFDKEILKEVLAFIRRDLVQHHMDTTSQTLLQIIETKLKLRIQEQQQQQQQQKPDGGKGPSEDVNWPPLVLSESVAASMSASAPAPRPAEAAAENELDVTRAVSPAEMARQASLLEFSLFAAIRPSELQRRAWSAPDKATRAPGVVRMIAHFNRMSAWAVQVALQGAPGPERLAARLAWLILLASELANLRNYSSMLWVLVGLRSAPLARLEAHWALLPPAVRARFDELDRAWRPSENWKQARETHRLAASAPPAIPHLGVYLSELAHLEQTMPDLLGPGLVHYEKHHRIGQLLRQLMQFQQVPYPHRPDERLLARLRAFHNAPPTPTQLMALSFQILPPLASPSSLSPSPSTSAPATSSSPAPASSASHASPRSPPAAASSFSPAPAPSPSPAPTSLGRAEAPPASAATLPPPQAVRSARSRGPSLHQTALHRAADEVAGTTSTAARGAGGADGEAAEGGRKLSVLLATPWQVSSTSFQLVVQAALAHRFPDGYELLTWQAFDRDATVYSWPDHIRLELIEEQRLASGEAPITFILYTRQHVNRADISLLRRLQRFYESVTRRRNARGLIVRSPCSSLPVLTFAY
jgi:hypothetical protein